MLRCTALFIQMTLVLLLSTPAWSQMAPGDNPFSDAPDMQTIHPDFTPSAPPSSVLQATQIAAPISKKVHPWLVSAEFLSGGYQFGGRAMQPIYGGQLGVGYHMMGLCEQKTGSVCLESALSLKLGGGTLFDSQAGFFQGLLGANVMAYFGSQRVFAPYLSLQLGYRYQEQSGLGLPADSSWRLSLSDESGHRFVWMLGGGIMFHLLGATTGPAIYAEAAASMRLGGTDGLMGSVGFRYRF